MIAALCGSPASAQQWPSRPVRLVAAGTPGGTADIVARLVADGLARELKQPVIVEPRPGAAGGIAVGDIAQAPHDGHTALVAVNSLVSEIPHIVKLPVDTSKAIRPLVELGRGGLVMVGNASLPAQDLRGVIAYVKAHPGKVSYASYSAGTFSHLLGLQLNKAAGIDLLHVAYKGSTPALNDVIGGHVPLMFDGLPTSLPLIRAGRIKAFAITTPARSALLPSVPTFAELGYAELEVIAWMALWTAPEVPASVQARLRDATLQVLPQVRGRLQELGFDPPQPRSPEEMSRALRADYERVGAMLRSIGFRQE